MGGFENSWKGLLNFPVTCNHTEIDECSTNPCQNGGSCLDGGGWHVCLCQEGFTGKDCEKCERNLIKSFQMKIHYQYYTWILYHIIWIDPKLKREIKNKNKLFLKFKKYPTQLNSVMYKNQKRFVNRELKKSQRNYYNNKLNKQFSNPKKYWKVIKELIGDNPNTVYPEYLVHENRLIYQTDDIATHFNNYFINVGRKLAETLFNSPYLCYTNEIFLQPIHHVKKILITLIPNPFTLLQLMKKKFLVILPY